MICMKILLSNYSGCCNHSLVDLDLGGDYGIYRKLFLAFPWMMRSVQSLMKILQRHRMNRMQKIPQRSFLAFVMPMTRRILSS